MLIEFEGEIFFWRGPAPYLFVAIPDKESAYIKAVSTLVSYGWGVIPVRVRIGGTEWKTSLFPKDGCYLVPIRVSVQRTENIGVGDRVVVEVVIVLNQ